MFTLFFLHCIIFGTYITRDSEIYITRDSEIYITRDSAFVSFEIKIF